MGLPPGATTPRTPSGLANPNTRYNNIHSPFNANMGSTGARAAMTPTGMRTAHGGGSSRFVFGGATTAAPPLGVTASPLRTSRGAGGLLMQSSFGEVTSALGTPGSMGNGGGMATVRDVAMMNRMALLHQIHQRQVHNHIKNVYQHKYQEDVSDPVVAREVDALSQSLSQQPQDFILGFVAEEEEGSEDNGDGFYHTRHILDPEVSGTEDVRRSPMLYSTLHPHTPRSPLLEPVDEEPSSLDSRPNSISIKSGSHEAGVVQGAVSGSGVVGSGEGKKKKRLSLELSTEEAVQRRREIEQRQDQPHSTALDKAASTYHYCHIHM